MLDQPPRIAHVITQSGPFGGAQRNTLLTLKGLVRDGYQAELICGSGGPLIAEARALGIAVHDMPELVRQVDVAKDLHAFLRLYRLFRSGRYDVVHTHSTKAGFLGRVAAWLARVPAVIHTVHGVPFEIDGGFGSRVYLGLERLVALVTDSLVSVGEALRQELVSWKVAPARKLVTIYSGIDFSSYVPGHSVLETKQRLGLEGAWPIAGCIGRLCEQKAQDSLVAAAALLRDRYPKMKLVLVGDGELRPSLEQQVEQLGLLSSVCFLGERDDIADLLGIFDVYVMSSRWEGVGRALTEAMYWGLPIVATSVNGVKEVIVHDETGLLVPPRNPQALADALDRVVSSPDLARRLASSARRTALELMDGERMIRAIEALYARVSRPALAARL